MCIQGESKGAASASIEFADPPMRVSRELGVSRELRGAAGSKGVASASIEFSNASNDSHCALLFTSLPSPSCLSSSSCPCPPATACREKKWGKP